MKLAVLLLLLSMYSTQAMTRPPLMEQCRRVFLEISAAIHLAPNVSNLRDDKNLGDVPKCLMEYTNICQMDGTNNKIMIPSNTVIADQIIKGTNLYSTTFKDNEIKCILALMPKRQFDPCLFLYVCVPEFKDYENCINMFGDVKEAVKQKCHGGSEKSGSGNVCDCFCGARKCQNASLIKDNDYNQTLYKCDCGGGKSAAEDSHWPIIRIFHTSDWYYAESEKRALLVALVFMTVGVIGIFCCKECNRYGQKQKRLRDREQYHDIIY